MLLADTLGAIWADDGILVQAFMAGLRDAARASCEGSKVTVIWSLFNEISACK